MAAPQRPPTFAAYPAREIYAGPRATPKLRPRTDAWRFRTRIRQIARQKLNFAGHYCLGSWGCGSECLHFAIVDARTGSVYYRQDLSCDYAWGLHHRDVATPIAFQLTSRLLVLDCALGASAEVKPHYYQFAHGRLVPVP